MPTRQVSNGNVTVWWVTSIADPAAPTAAEINAGLNLSEAIAWNNFELGSSGSSDVDDRAITDVGNAVSRGFPDFSATLDFFRDANQGDSTSIYNQAFTLFKQPGLNGFLVVRYGQTTPSAVAAANQIVSVYKFVTDVVADDTEGEDSVKLEVTFMPQGILHEHVVVKTASAVAATPATMTLAVDDLDKITAKVGGQDMTAAASYVSDDPTIATVSSTGVVKGVSAGTADITVSHPGSTGSGTVAVTVS
jgi:hypothetical protein